MISINSATGFLGDEMDQLVSAVQKVNELLLGSDLGPALSAAQALLPGGVFAGTPDSVGQVLAAMRTDLKVDFFIFTPSWWKRHFSREVAYEDSQGVHFDRNKFDGESFAEICNTVGHESTHKAGYVHPYQPCLDRDNSLPYQFGNVIEALVEGENLK